MKNIDLKKIPPFLGFNLIEWKILFGQVFIFQVEEKYIAFRPLTIKEVEALISLVEKLEEYIIDDWVIEKALLTTEHRDFILEHSPAGLAASLSNAILSKSTPKSIEETMELVEKQRAINEASPGKVMDNLVKMGAGNLLKDTKSLTYKQQIEYLVFSEEVTGKKFEIQKQTLPKNVAGKRLSREAASILSKESADKPNFERDNAELRDL